MPRIDAPTVAEHRAVRRRALLDAARDLLTAQPDHVPSLAEVGARAGLSRSSVYQYFTSREDLLSAVVADSFPRWQHRLDAAVAGAADPRDRVLAFLRANLQLVADGEHALARALVVAAPSEDLARQSREFHDRLLEPVTRALADLGAPDPATMTALIGALLHTASVQVEQDGDLDRAAAALDALVGAYLHDLGRG
ncbi:TetR/AcrR family transcriptional regulator [Cellulomonas denverensis]|uniref:TetR/AcrR family transcriptional regulator n=1 Tax=Cellulomonas denverensis TaxID=264297 RepID=A0A7X6KV91_9CELL|nr:TetR/AcrR family transcriptional regulator [Cellulomonas denverensis]NKY22445.1 TetR/AcrR family transcriptional regulator [Cellulomonas denverensis]GIG25918.1 TetR family transcriptional regulator [Cellulomonas denverensis]